MKCPQCGKPSDVIDSRAVPGGVRRRRHCFNDHRFTTYEIEAEAAQIALIVKALAGKSTHQLSEILAAMPA